MDKPFLSINDQIKLLNARGVKTDDNTYNLLLSEGYYSLLNRRSRVRIAQEAPETPGRWLAIYLFC